MKKLLYFIIAILVLIALAVGAIFLFSDTIMKKVLDKELNEVRDKYGVQVEYEGLKFNDLSSMTFNGISVYKLDANKSVSDTIVTVDSLTATAQLRSLMKKKLKLDRLAISGVEVSLKMKKHRNDADADSVDIEKKDENEDGKKSVYEKFNQATGLFFRMMPEQFSLSDLNVSVESDSFYAKIAVPRFQIKDDKFESDIICQEMTHEIQNISLTGTYQRKNQTVSADIQSNIDTAKVIVPLVEYKYGAKISANLFSLKVSVDADEDAELFKIRGNASAEYLSIYHERLSSQTLNCGAPSAEFLLNIDKNSVELDSSTVVRLEKLEFSPYVKLEKGDNFGLTIKLDKDRFPADDLFSSIPRGLMPSLEGIKVDGDIDYHLLFSFDMDNIDSLQFTSSMKKYPGFKITKFGNVDLRKMQDTFTYLAYDQNVLQRRILLSEHNPNYRKLDDISVYLKNAVLFSEDPSFFRHHGFLESALRESMVKNIKEKRFARGGSTISMQLVKNVFLNREKKLQRKAEEAMIVWLIENNALTSKERMYEVYLNVIEWGPNVYGAAEAAKFYFDKEPSKLSVEEAIYLAMIIPRPKKFKWCFDDEGKLRDSYEQYFSTISGRMLNAELISEKEKDKISCKNVVLTGDAANMLKKGSSAPVEEEDVDETEEKPSLFKKLFKFRKNGK